ncbi:uncharacterized protein LOC124634119 [Helicoverpa zea]|uniref:uncharacterized protein LOC124634119 n=1 Tax=Helicoverpa zea TaxID=7113 RepID=UPI001F5A387F|nr:uncharacterized protein LOC124634119 [Helicoverpa zea]
METLIEKNKNKDDEREWDEDSDSESASSDGAAGDLRVPQSKKDHRVDAFLKRKKDDLGSSSCGRGAPAKKADRRPEKGRVAEAPKDKGGAAQQSSSEEDSAAVGSDQERRANFAKTVAAAFKGVSQKRLGTSKRKAIDSASATIIAAAEASFGQAPKSDLAKLQEEVARLTAALNSLLEENRSLRADLRKIREQEAERSGTTSQRPQPSPVESQVLALVRQEMAAFQARFSVLEGRVLRPPLAAPKPPAAQRKGTAEQATCGGAERAAQEGGCTAKAQGRNNGPGAEDPGANTSTGSVVGTSGETPSEAESICGPYLPCHSVRVAGGGGKQKETEGGQSGQKEGPKTAAQTASRRGAAPRP